MNENEMLTQAETVSTDVENEIQISKATEVEEVNIEESETSADLNMQNNDEQSNDIEKQSELEVQNDKSNNEIEEDFLDLNIGDKLQEKDDENKNSEQDEGILKTQQDIVDELITIEHSEKLKVDEMAIEKENKELPIEKNGEVPVIEQENEEPVIEEQKENNATNENDSLDNEKNEPLDKNGDFDVKNNVEFQSFIKNQIKEYDKSAVEYHEWTLKSKLLPIEVTRFVDKVEKLICDFDLEYKSIFLEELESEFKKFVTNRAKGIELIRKMTKNITLSLSKFENISINDVGKISIEEDIRSITSIAEMTKFENEIYNKVTLLKSDKDKLIREYFRFITDNVLNIIDGLEAGIQFIEKKNYDNEINSMLKNVYTNIKNEIEGFLKGINVAKINIKEGDLLDFKLHEVFDLEETDIKENNEKIFEIIRSGYIYNQPLFGLENNYIVRQTQVIVYKYI